MVILSNSDMFEVRVNSLIADYDRETLTNLYQPIIGYSAMSVYFTLWSEASIQKVLSYSTHEQLLMRMKMAPGHFVDARKVLEAVGLIKTRLEKAPGTNIYHYEVNAPKTPKGFFADTLLFGMLIQALGENDANRLKRVYEVSYKEEGEDVSASFQDVFHPDFEDPSFLIAAKTGNQDTIGRNKIQIDTEFSYEKFFKALGEHSQINERAISKKEMKEIERLASLYGVDEESTAIVAANAYDPSKDKGSRLDFDLINKSLMNEANYSFIRRKSRTKIDGTINSDTDLARKINLFEKTTPKDMLSLFQGGTKAAPSDLAIINTLSKDYQLPNGVINVIIDFVLSMNKNVLSRAYAEKVAASFNRENIETTIDAMNYCNEVINKNSGNKNARKVKNEEKIEEDKPIKNSKNKKVTDDDWNKLFEEEESEDDKTETELPF